MSFGLKDSPITWQRTIITALGELLGVNKIAYIDDIITFTKTLENRVVLLEKIFQKLTQYKLRLKREKPKIYKEKVEYLGT